MQHLLPLREGGLLLGVRSDEAYPEEKFLLEPGDRLLIYTDGLVEATNPEGLEFGNVRLEEFIRGHIHLSADQFAGELLEEVLAWPGSNHKHLQSDDITIVVIDVGR
jgi:sigma-B regulation protein RsbU (phosphoserine phosphatase)